MTPEQHAATALRDAATELAYAWGAFCDSHIIEAVNRGCAALRKEADTIDPRGAKNGTK